MLETEEVDVDYFTPSASTSLSKIFGSSFKEENNVFEKSTLKYNAPLPPQVSTKYEEPKQMQHLFAGTVYAYEWVNNSYEFRGRLGFAILKISNFDIHKMVIYDSNKTTLSSLTIVHNVVIKINGKVSISYYDDQPKFWSVNPSTANLEEILQILKSLQVNLEHIQSVEETNNLLIAESVDVNEATIKKLNKDEKESDTDTSFNRRTKDSILKRMATMGQSVLPPPHTVTAQTSDSSDTNEPQNQLKFRHKPKVMSKKSLLEKKMLDIDAICEQQTTNVKPPKPETHETNNDVCKTNVNKQNVPLNTIDTINLTDVGAEAHNLGLLISEQKVSNNELKINMDKMADKLELLLNKVKDLEVVENVWKSGMSVNNSNVSQFQNEIIQKLLNEYEKKINKYEEFIKLKGFNCDTLENTSKSKNDIAYQSLKNTEEDIKLQQLCYEKDKEIFQLKEDMQNKEEQFKNVECRLVKEINDLKNNFSLTHKYTTDKNIDETKTNRQTDEITNKIKQIMNDTFQAISINFNDDETYSGSKIKNIVGLVVKKTTIESLKDF